MSLEYSTNFEQEARANFVHTISSCWIEALCADNYIMDHTMSNGNVIARFERGNIDTYQRFTLQVKTDPTAESLTPESLLYTKTTFGDNWYDVEQVLVYSDRQRYSYRTGRFDLDLLDSKHKQDIYNMQMQWRAAGIVKLERLTHELLDSDPVTALRR